MAKEILEFKKITEEYKAKVESAGAAWKIEGEGQQQARGEDGKEETLADVFRKRKL